MSGPVAQVNRAYELACVTNAATVGTFAYVAPDSRPPIAALLDAATRAAWTVR